MLSLNNCEQLEANLNGWFVFTAAAYELTSWKADTVIFLLICLPLVVPWQFWQGGFFLGADKALLLHTADLIARGEGMLHPLMQSYLQPAESSFGSTEKTFPGLLQ